MRLLALGLAAIACCAHGASEAGNSISRFGNYLLVTAPDTGKADPHLAAALRGRVTIDLVDAGMGDVAEMLRKTSGANVVCDPDVLINSPTITLQVKDMSLGNVIGWVSRQAGCDCVPMHGALYFTHKPDSAPKVTRLYDISALTIDTPDFPGPELAMTTSKDHSGVDLFVPAPRESGDRDQKAEELIELLKKQVQPGSWRE
jgi:hypothetical protein